METTDILLIVLACVVGVAVLLFFAKRKKPGPVPRPGAAVTTKTSTAPTPPARMKTVPTAAKSAAPVKPVTPGKPVPPGAKPQDAAQKPPLPETVVLFSAVPVRNIRKCLSCDGENAPDTKLCCICGRRL